MASFLAPPPGFVDVEQDFVADLVAYSADVRWRTEQGGIVASNGMHIKTDGEAQRKIGQLRLRTERGEIPVPFNFKAFNGWLMMDQANLAIIDADMAAHVRLCYEAERKLYDLIVGGVVTTEQQVSEYYRTFCFEPYEPMTIESLAPTEYPADGAEPLVLTVKGTNFCGLGQILFDGKPVQTYLISLTELRGLVLDFKSKVGVIPIQIEHPGDIKSNIVNFTVTAVGSPMPDPEPVPPQPVISSLTPNTARFDKVWAASINGSFFVNGAVVSIGGTPVTTTFVNASQVTVSAPKNLFQTIGATFPVTVTNPDGLMSNAMTLTVVA
jgi:hypothetical protein